jgi:hypothetical protein
MNVSNMKDKLYFTYGEILQIILSDIFSKSNNHINNYYKVELVEQVVIDVNDAVEDRELIPIIIDKPYSKIGDFNWYTVDVRALGIIVGLFAMCILLNHFWIDPKIRYEILKDSPKFDLLEVIIKLMWVFLCCYIIHYFEGVYGWIRIFVLKAKSNTSVGMIKYQITEAKNRGYTSSAYYTDSVVNFLESKYGIKIDPDVYENADENVRSSECHKTPENQYGQVNQQFLLDAGLPMIIFKPLEEKKDKELSEKMRRVALAGHAPLRKAKKEIESFIKNEIPPPCTCYHIQICRYIIKNQKKDGFEAPLTFVDLDGKEKNISKEILTDIARKIMNDYDPSRVCDRPMKMEPCKKHLTK